MNYIQSFEKTRSQASKRVSSFIFDRLVNPLELTTEALRSRFFLGVAAVLCLLPLASHGAGPGAASVAVTTQHNNNYRTGQTNQETILNTSNVNVQTFGKKFSINVASLVNATIDPQTKIMETQVLFVPSVSFPGKGIHNAIYYCTFYNNTCFASDADSSQAPLWQTSLGLTIPGNNQGVRSTPVIDTAAKTIYVVSRTNDGHQHFRLHALDITTGQEKPNSPVEIQGSVVGNGSASVNGIVHFDPALHSQRPGLLLQNGNVYIAFGSFTDISPSHGWVFSYNASTLQFNSVVSTSPNTDLSGIWQDGAGIAADDNGFIYVQTANRFGYPPVGSVEDFSNSVLKISTSNNVLSIVDYFTPSNQKLLNQTDADLSSSGPLLIPNTNIGAGGGEDGILYVWNNNNLGQFSPVVNQVLEYWQLTTNRTLVSLTDPGDYGIWAGNVYYDGTDPANGVPNGILYNWGMNDKLKSINFKNQRFDQVNVGSGTLKNVYGQRLSLSSNGIKPGTAILWTHGFNRDFNNNLASGLGGIVRAFDATNVATLLWDSSQNAARDSVCASTVPEHFRTGISPPTIANGKVYVASAFCGVITVYGLL